MDNVEFLEVRSGSWNGAADEIISKLNEAGVQKGQIIGIDAHNNGPYEDAIFSAHFDKTLPSFGDLDIVYHVQNTDSYGWNDFYANASSSAAGKTREQLISMTASCNWKGRGVMYVFSYADSPRMDNIEFLGVCSGSWNGAADEIISKLSKAGVQKGQIISVFSYADSPRMGSIEFLEVRSGSWNGAADEIISKLNEAGVQKGQIISIDAHNNGPDKYAIFSAHFDKTLPSFGDLDIVYHVQNTDSYGWNDFYANAASSAAGKTKEQLISMTASCNCEGRGVMYVFSYALF